MTRGRKPDPTLAPKRDTFYLRPPLGARKRWEDAAKRAGRSPHGWIVKTLNDAATRSEREHQRLVDELSGSADDDASR